MAVSIPLAERYGNVWCKKCREVVFQTLIAINGAETYRCEKRHKNTLQTRRMMDDMIEDRCEPLPTKKEIEALRNSEDHWSENNFQYKGV